MHFLAKYLLKYEKIDGEEFEKLMRGEMPESVLYENEVIDSTAETNEENTEI